MSKLIVGCGYLGQRVARLWQAAGESVYCTTRSRDRVEQWRQQGFETIVADVTRPETLGRLPPADTILFAVGYDRRAEVSRHDVYAGGLEALLNAIDARGISPERIILISSTGVYSEAGGAWVVEESPCGPMRESGRALLAAEEALRRHPLADRGLILRMAGIYGPGRIPGVDVMDRAELLAMPTDALLNLIHADDAASAVVAAAAGPRPPRTYNISDGQPVARRDFYRELARLVGRPDPVFCDAHADQGGRGRNNKRVSNLRMRDELGVSLRYPSYREGLAAITALMDTDESTQC